MSSNLVSNVTITGNLLVQGSYSNVGALKTGTMSAPSGVLIGGTMLGAKAAAGGGIHTAVVLNDGTVRTFGLNSDGQLGVNDAASRSTPVQVFGISSSATAVACGYKHTAVLLADGTVRTFGRNNTGQLGDNTTVSKSTPVQVFGISSSATAVTCGKYHTAVLLSDGTVRTFGDGNSGRLGDNTNVDKKTPVQVWGISSSATAVAGGGYHTAVLLADGTVRTFGYNAQGQLGDNTTVSKSTPVQVWDISSSATAVSCGRDHIAVLLADGTVRTFGSNDFGQLGIDNLVSRLTPVQVFGISSSATAIACGDQHTVILLANGTVMTIGRNNNGQLGINVTAGTRMTPVQVFGISSSAVAIACGGAHTAVLLADGTVRMFGNNTQGSLGVNDLVDRSTPVTVVNISAYPYAQFPALNLGPVTSPQYQLELTTDYARKLTTSTWTIGSDERLKTDIETANVDRCVDIIQNLDLKYFKWDFPSVNPTDSHSLGWIAQEFAQFFPNSVNEAPAHGIMDFKNLNSDQIIKVMWGALKKLRADLKSRKSSDSELSTAGDNASPTPE
jgi:alpha-tubulin suppressor-like RCC1 family protein